MEHVADARDGDGFASANLQVGCTSCLAATARCGLAFAPRFVVKPILQALLVADHVYQDQVTGKKIVAGIFHNLYYQKVVPNPIADDSDDSVEPKTQKVRVTAGGHRAGSPFCYVSLTEVRGEQEFELRYVDLDDDKPIIQATFKLKSPSPVDTIEAILPLPLLPVGKAGTFALELLWHDEPLGAHRINVIEVKPEGDGNGN